MAKNRASGNVLAPLPEAMNRILAGRLDGPLRDVKALQAVKARSS